MIDNIILFTTNYWLLQSHSLRTNDNGDLGCYHRGIHISIIRHNGMGRGVLYISTQLPCLIHRSNLYPVTEDDFEGITTIIARALVEVGIELRISVKALRVSRVDYCVNIIIDDDTGRYIDALNRHSQGRLNKTVYTRETATFFNKRYQITFYDKVASIKAKEHRHCPLPNNILRIELKLMKSEAIRRKLDLKAPTFIDVYSYEKSHKNIVKAFDMLTNNSGKVDDDCPRKRSYHRPNMISVADIESIIVKLDYDWKALRKWLVSSGKCSDGMSYRVVRRLRTQFEQADTEHTRMIKKIREKLLIAQSEIRQPANISQKESTCKR